MPDRPDPPEVKLMIRRNLAVRGGKEFDEAKERRVLGLPSVASPEFIAENLERTKETRRQDLAGKQELATIAEQARQADTAMRLREQDEQIAELRKQIAMLTGGGAPPVRLVAEPATGESPAPLPGDRPTEDWTMKQIVQWGAERGIHVPGQGKASTKRAAVEFIYAELEARTEPPAKEPEEDDTLAEGERPFDPSVPEEVPV